jgi:hypothetical protein
VLRAGVVSDEGVEVGSDSLQGLLLPLLLFLIAASTAPLLASTAAAALLLGLRQGELNVVFLLALVLQLQELHLELRALPLDHHLAHRIFRHHRRASALLPHMWSLLLFLHLLQNKKTFYLHLF